MPRPFVFLCMLSLLMSVIRTEATLSGVVDLYCPDRSFKQGSAFEANRNLVLSSISSNASFSSGFYNVTAGHDPPDVVYGNFLCRGDLTADVCRKCVVAASKTIVQQCPMETEAIIVYDECVLRYANRSIFSVMEEDPSIIQVKNPKDFIEPEPYRKTLENMMTGLVTQVAVVPSTAEKRFATKEGNVTKFATLYSLAQCTPEISVSDCGKCLNIAMTLLDDCCSGSIGGRVLLPSCNVRYEVYPFYHVNTTAPPPQVKSNASRIGSPSPQGVEGRKALWIIVGTSVPVFLMVVLLGFCIFNKWRRKGADKEENKNTSQDVQLLDFEGGRFADDYPNENLQRENQVNSPEFPLIPLDLIHTATQYFSNENKLGEGGFGPVYKGILVDGKEIAVKRLSKTSGQGLQEFKNEVTLIAKLQHRNLVRLLGCCLEGDELLLIYEYLPNKSLDIFLFDSTRGAKLAWKRRLSIIHGIARGLLYLHEDSRLKIIHRDLKASNILLDHEMNPKISDFGMARIFSGNQSEANTKKVAGTYGYMAPEYAMEGLFSVKSDVFSFGVLMLEIVSGKKNNGFHLSEHGQSLLTFAWKLWSEGQGLELVDPLIAQSCVAVEVVKCIHIGLLCVQEDSADRPTMSSVVVMLASNNVTLPQPTQPAFSIGRIVAGTSQSTPDIIICSANEVTLSEMSPR